MPIPYEKLDFKTLFHNQAAYERIDSVGKKLHPKWNIVEFEKTLFGAGENHFFKAGQEEVLKAELSALNDAMPFLKFGEGGQHYAYELFLSAPDRGWGARGMPFYGHIWHVNLLPTNCECLKLPLQKRPE